MKYVYLLRNDLTGDYKIGVSVNPKKRVKTLQTGSSGQIHIIETFQSEYPYKIESMFHNRHRADRLEGEWFALDMRIEDEFLKQCELSEKNFKLLDEESTFSFNKSLFNF